MFIVYFSDSIQGFITLILTKGSDSAEKAEKEFIKKNKAAHKTVYWPREPTSTLNQRDGENHPESVMSAIISLTTRGTAARADAASYMDSSPVPRTQTTVTPAI